MPAPGTISLRKIERTDDRRVAAGRRTAANLNRSLTDWSSIVLFGTAPGACCARNIDPVTNPDVDAGRERIERLDAQLARAPINSRRRRE